jgi:hypothetical protein
MEEFISKGYLYTEWNGELTVKEGTVMRNQWCYQDEAIFRYSEKDGDWVKCHAEPEQIVFAKFWLPERNDELGRKILVEYHESQIDKLLRAVASHEAKVYKLKNA